MPAMATTLTPYSQLSALIVDDMAVQQTTLRGQLASLGIGKVDTVSTADDAIRQMRGKRYSLILCDFNLNHRTDGQQFFEYLRDNKLLPADCLFFMITAESGYASVASATEHRPDAYLLKPITAADIGDRLQQVLERRQALLPVTQCLQQGKLVEAVERCDELLQRRDRWTMQVLQLKGETLLNLGRHEDAKLLYRQALEVRSDLMWAQLGLARAHKAANQLDEARMLAQDILRTPEGANLIGAYDVMIEANEALGHTDAALNACREAAQVVPSTRRHRLLADAAYRQGDLETARDSLQRVTRATHRSLAAQPQDTLLLAQTLVDSGDARAALDLLKSAAQGGQRPEAAVEASVQAIKAQALALSGDQAGALQCLMRAKDGSINLAKPDLPALALARAELRAGDETAGLALLSRLISADHENPRVRQLVGKALNDTGHADKAQQVIDGAAAELDSRVKQARALFRDSRIDDALGEIEAALREHPDNTGVLLQAAQMNCLSLRLTRQRDNDRIERIHLYLGRLEKLMPASDRVIQMRRYFRETIDTLPAVTAVAAPRTP